MKAIRSLWVVGVLALGLPADGWADGSALVQEQCSSCHAVTQPDYSALGRQERAERKGPPLHYAGNKFRAEWLVAWLQKPERIYPAGVFAPAHAQKTAEGDIVAPDSLPTHPVLAAAEAQAAADYLMTLRPFDALLAAETYEPGTIALRMGQMNFAKFKGCNACHRDEPTAGGLSGPELYTAWNRLQPAYITAFIANPAAWDPHSIMPRAPLNAAEVHKLANYLKVLTEEQP